MGLNSSLEPRLHWLGFPNLIRGLTIIQFVVTIALMLKPGMGEYLAYNHAAFVGGDYWRVISHFFLLHAPPPADTPPGLDPIGLLFALFALWIGFLLNDSLENAWGVFRTSMFVYGCIAGQVIANLILGTLNLPYQDAGGIYLDMAIFLAFATVFPAYSFRLMLLLPVPAWVIAAITAVGLLLQCASSPLYAFFIILAFAPYWIWAIPRLLKHNKNRAAVQKRRIDFRSKGKGNEGNAFHECEICGATELSNPELSFRITADDAEICSDCLEKS